MECYFAIDPFVTFDDLWNTLIVFKFMLRILNALNFEIHIYPSMIHNLFLHRKVNNNIPKNFYYEFTFKI